MVTFETKAWISQYNSIAPDQIRTEKGAASLYYSRADVSADGYTFAGAATITFDPLDRGALIDNKVASLREQAKSIRAEATAKVTQIEGQIQQLLCIENSPKSSSESPANA